MQDTFEVTADAFRPDQIEIAHEWWRAQSWPELPLEMLSKTGVVTSVDGEPAAMGWFYKSDSTLGYMEWIVANPKIRREKRTAALNLLIEELLKRAKEAGFTLIFMSVHNESLKNRLEKQGFQATDKNMTNMIWRA